MVFKFNNGHGAILCDGVTDSVGCGTMLLSGVKLEDAPQHGRHMCRACANKYMKIERYRTLRKVVNG